MTSTKGETKVLGGGKRFAGDKEEDLSTANEIVLRTQDVELARNKVRDILQSLLKLKVKPRDLVKQKNEALEELSEAERDLAEAVERRRSFERKAWRR